MRGLESALRRKEIELESTLSGMRGLENKLRRKIDRAKKHIMLKMRAQRHSQNEKR
jgi:hypothetical protein